jgi:hypothetical protein
LRLTVDWGQTQDIALAPWMKSYHAAATGSSYPNWQPVTSRTTCHAFVPLLSLSYYRDRAWVRGEKERRRHSTEAARGVFPPRRNASPPRSGDASGDASPLLCVCVVLPNTIGVWGHAGGPSPPWPPWPGRTSILGLRGLWVHRVTDHGTHKPLSLDHPMSSPGGTGRLQLIHSASALLART